MGHELIFNLPFNLTLMVCDMMCLVCSLEGCQCVQSVVTNNQPLFSGSSLHHWEKCGRGGGRIFLGSWETNCHKYMQYFTLVE